MKVVEVIFIDFKKVFDSILHHQLIFKPQRMEKNKKLCGSKIILVT